MQPELSFKEKRENYKIDLRNLESIIKGIFGWRPDIISIKKGNALIRYVWANTKDYSAGSILRIARKVRAEGLDNEENQNERANAETTYNEHFKL